MDKIDGMTMNIEQANVEKLKEIFPEVFADVRWILSGCSQFILQFLSEVNEWIG